MNSSFMVTPMNQKIDLVAGETYTGFITVINPADAISDFSYYVSVSPYSVVGEEYDVDLETISNYSAIVDWITIDEPKGTLAPNETRDVGFTIKVPEAAAAGGQYATLLVGQDTEVPQNEGLTIQNIYEIASIIYANVEGETVHDGSILENKVPGFSFEVPVVASAIITNGGNVHETARVSVTVKNAFTGEVIFPQNDENNTIEEVIMPESTRYVTRNIDSIAPLGIYDIKQMVVYMGDLSISEQRLVVCPLWFLLLVLITISAVLAGVIRAIIKHKRRKQVF